MVFYTNRTLHEYYLHYSHQRHKAGTIDLFHHGIYFVLIKGLQLKNEYPLTAIRNTIQKRTLLGRTSQHTTIFKKTSYYTFSRKSNLLTMTSSRYYADFISQVLIFLMREFWAVWENHWLCIIIFVIGCCNSILLIKSHPRNFLFGGCSSESSGS